MRYYDAECMHLFEAAISLNRQAGYRDKLKECYTDARELDSVLRHWADAPGKVVVYGIGYYGQSFIRYAQAASLRVDALVVTDGEPLHEMPGCDLPIYEVSNLPYVPDECTVIIAVQAQNVRRLIEKELRYRGYFRIL